jgi:hypothetical protein
MTLKSPLPQLSRTCVHPECCSREAAATEAACDSAAKTRPDPPQNQGAALWSSLKRSVLWFLAFFGIYASSSICPFCGTPGCPVGAGGAALVGGVFACLWQYGKSAWEKARGFMAGVQLSAFSSQLYELKQLLAISQRISRYRSKGINP